MTPHTWTKNAVQVRRYFEMLLKHFEEIRTSLEEGPGEQTKGGSGLRS